VVEADTVDDLLLMGPNAIIPKIGELTRRIGLQVIIETFPQAQRYLYAPGHELIDIGPGAVRHAQGAERAGAWLTAITLQPRFCKPEPGVTVGGILLEPALRQLHAGLKLVLAAFRLQPLVLSIAQMDQGEIRKPLGIMRIKDVRKVELLGGLRQIS